MTTLRNALALLLVFPVACGHTPQNGGAEIPANDAESWTEERRVELPAAQVWIAAQSAVAEDGAVIALRRATSDGGEIVARRPEGHRVQVTVIAVDGQSTRVSVAVSPSNGTLAAMIHGRIGDRLSLRKAQSELFGETSVETVYDRSLEAALAAAEETCRAMELEVVRRKTEDAEARIEARDRDSHAIRFSLRRIGGGGAETAVMFTAEAAGGDTLDILRREFERRLFPARD
jgi:hypothetical protein